MIKRHEKVKKEGKFVAIAIVHNKDKVLAHIKSGVLRMKNTLINKSRMVRKCKNQRNYHFIKKLGEFGSSDKQAEAELFNALTNSIENNRFLPQNIFNVSEIGLY